jgi:DNA-binding FadR family transcriptional regulator
MSSPADDLEFTRPIVRESIAEMVAHRVLEMVKAGVLKPGDQLPPERDLALSLNVSRPTVREAIRGLSILGVVRTRQGGGAYVSELDADALLGPIQFYLSLENVNIGELYDARSLIESDVARRAAERMTDDELASLEAILDEQAGILHDAIAFRMSDYRFHETIWAGARNAFLKRMGESLNVLGLDFRKRASETEGVLKQSYRDHRQLLRALKSHDPDAAAAAAARHMRNVYRSTIDQFSKNEAGR